MIHFLDRGSFVAALGEQRPRDVDELVAALATGHPGAGRPRFLVWRGHAYQVIGLAGWRRAVGRGPRSARPVV